MSVFLSQSRNIFDTKQEFMFIWTNLNVIFIQIKKKSCILQVTIFFLLNSRLFFFTNKNIPHPPKVKWSNIEYSIKLFFPREVRDKNKESSIYAQNSWIVDIYLILCTWQNVATAHRRVWRYQRGNQNPYIEEEQTTQWPKRKRTNNDL